MSWPWIVIGIGALVILTRGPLIFSPTATLAFYQEIWATDGRVRVGGALFVALGLGILGAAPATTQLPLAIGTVLLGVAAWMLAVPAHFRSFVDGVMSFIEESVDSAAVRFLGVLAVAIGAFLIWLGARAL